MINPETTAERGQAALATIRSKSGPVRRDELRFDFCQWLPNLLERTADHLGVSVPELLAMQARGELTFEHLQEACR